MIKLGLLAYWTSIANAVISIAHTPCKIAEHASILIKSKYYHFELVVKYRVKMSIFQTNLQVPGPPAGLFWGSPAPTTFQSKSKCPVQSCFPDMT